MKRQQIQQGIALSGIVFSLLFLFPTPFKANSFPSVDSTTLGLSPNTSDDELNLVENGTQTLYIWGSITDMDGCEDVTEIGQVSAQFWRGNTGPNCSSDANYCYQANNCVFSGCTGLSDVDFDYQCSFDVQYFADSTTDGPYANEQWNARVIAQDGFLAQDTGSDTIELNTLIGVDVGDIDYGALDLGSTSSPTALEIFNTGNAAIDLDIKASGNLTCSGSGYIPLENARYDLNSGTTWEEATSLTTNNLELELDMDARTNELENTAQELFFQLKMPESGVSGVCSNTITTTVKADAEGGW